MGTWMIMKSFSKEAPSSQPSLRRTELGHTSLLKSFRSCSSTQTSHKAHERAPPALQHHRSMHSSMQPPILPDDMCSQGTCPFCSLPGMGRPKPADIWSGPMCAVSPQVSHAETLTPSSCEVIS